jgi:hypothetical protein
MSAPTDSTTTETPTLLGAHVQYVKGAAEVSPISLVIETIPDI